jgi:hypothetical protein
MSNVCEHGQLARSCEICEKDQEIAELRQQLEEMTKAVLVKHERACSSDRAAAGTYALYKREKERRCRLEVKTSELRQRLDEIGKELIAEGEIRCSLEAENEVLREQNTGMNNKLIKFREIISDLLPLLEAQAQASHLTDGFRPKRNKWDDKLEAIKEMFD